MHTALTIRFLQKSAGRILLLIGFNSFAQSIDPIDLLQTDENINAQQWENFFWTVEEQLNINEATIEQLMRLPELSITQASEIIDYRRRTGMIFTAYELATLPGITIGQARKIERQVWFGPEQDSTHWKEKIKYRSRNTVIYQSSLSLPHRRGTLEKEFVGGPVKSTLRLRSKVPNLYDFGLLLENDPGEAFRFDPGERYYGTDHVGVYLSLKNTPVADELILGNYQVSYGQGLVWGGGFYLGKQVIQSPYRPNRGLTPNGSSAEFGYLSGIALSRNFGPLQLDVFGSNQLIDAQVDSLGLFERIISPTGYHRTTRELASRKNVRAYRYGMNLTYALPKNKGLIGYTNSWKPGRPFYPEQFAQSMYYSKMYRFLHFYGEWALDNGWNSSFIHSLSIYPHHDFNFTFSYRNYHPDYQNDMAAGLSENTSPANETGIFSSLHLSPKGLFSLNAYFDIFKFHQPRFRQHLPDDGSDLRVLLEIPINRTNHLMMQYSGKSKTRATTNQELRTSQPLPFQQSNWRIQLINQPTTALKSTSRVQIGTYEQTAMKHGVALAQDFQYRPNTQWRLTARAAVFDTDFETRQYMYEHNVLYAFSIPAYLGKGTRAYLLSVYQWKMWRLRAKFARTHYDEPRTIGGGINERSGQSFYEFIIQLHLSL